MGVVEDGERRAGDRRTMAIRGPGAGGFTPAHSVAASNPCLNCGTNVQLTFCPECGQREIDADPTLREFLHELAEELFHWDGKLASTFRLLVTRPGALTTEYCAGRRVRYISPLRIYLTCSLLYFFLGSVIPRETIVANGRSITTHVGPITIGEGDSLATVKSLDSLAQHGRWVGRVWGRHFVNAMRNHGTLSESVTAWIPRAMFVMVPACAALVALAFRRYRRRFPQHLAFALHAHAFLFLLLSLTLARRATPNVAVQVIAEFVVIGATLIYVVKAMRNVYGVSTAGAIGRTMFVGATYAVAFTSAMVLTFGLIVLLQF